MLSDYKETQGDYTETKSDYKKTQIDKANVSVFNKVHD